MPALTPERPRQQERRRQIRGLLLVAAVVLVFSLLRADHVFTPGWWRLW
jgi:ferric-dicitrate binding protein FerR (iron transport regulator)